MRLSKFSDCGLRLWLKAVARSVQELQFDPPLKQLRMKKRALRGHRMPLDPRIRPPTLESGGVPSHNPDMRALRHLTFLHRCVLVWFVLSIGVAIAAPVVNPQSLELVCSAVGTVKVIAHTEDGAQEITTLGAHCPLCLIAGAPPPHQGSSKVAEPAPLGRAVEPIPAARLAAATAAPLPARGPPHLH